MNNPLVMGIDFGTDSVRSVIVDSRDGKEIADALHFYRRWSQGKYCDPALNQYRQHPLDYLEGLESSVRNALKTAPRGTAASIKAISMDTTGSTPCAVNRAGVPLALLPEFSEEADAMFMLWKDHTATKEADEINRLARSWGATDYTKYLGGAYSPEWFWAKILHILRKNSRVREAAWSWVEHCDWMPALLTGQQDPLAIKRSRCAAGHKAMWHQDFGGLPAPEFLTKLDPLLKGLRERLYSETYTADVVAGRLTPEWAAKLGLSQDVVVGVGALDAHMGAVGGQIEPYSMLKVMGTSTCDMVIAPKEEVGDLVINGISGQVDGSVIPGMIGFEAGQSAFGDIYAWFKDLLMWPLKNLPVVGSPEESGSYEEAADKISRQLLPELSKAASRLSPEQSGLLALDWLNGRRTPDANQHLKGVIAGLTLGSDAPGIFRALIEATAFGSKAIAERFSSQGIAIRSIIAAGGVAGKSPLVMQIVADVLNREIKVAASDQTVALGSAMFAAVAAGIYKDVEKAQQAMGRGFAAVYKPDPERAEKYQRMYQKYLTLGRFIEEQTGRVRAE